MHSRDERKARKRARYQRRNRWLDEDVTLKEFYRMRWTSLIAPVLGMIYCAWFFFFLGHGMVWYRPIMGLLFVGNAVLLLGPYWSYRTIVLPHMIFRNKLAAIDAIRQRHLDILAELGPDAMTVIFTKSERTDNDGRSIQ